MSQSRKWPKRIAALFILNISIFSPGHADDISNDHLIEKGKKMASFKRPALNKTRKVIGVGAGIVGIMNAYFVFKEAQNSKIPVRYTIYEKNQNLLDTTFANLVPSLTPDEILSVVPRGPELVQKLAIKFNEPGGIRVEDVAGVNDSEAAKRFIEAVQNYSKDEVGHNDRTQALLKLGKMSMDLWQNIYDEADDELRQILETSNFNPCREPRDTQRKLHDGYRIDLIYDVNDAEERAKAMKSSYDGLGYQNCKILDPAEVMELDPFLTDFCMSHSELDATGARIWRKDSVALWRPGGCIDAQIFMPKFYNYLKKIMGTYKTKTGKTKDNFQVKFGKKVEGVTYAKNGRALRVKGLLFSDGQKRQQKTSYKTTEYMFMPGEAVGTLTKLGFKEPPYAGFAGASLMLTIPATEEQLKKYATFNHCMEVHQEGVVLAWQARVRDSKIFIGVAGTKAFYADKRPDIEQAFGKNRNLLQFNMINDVLPEFISLALGRDTKGQKLTEQDLSTLEQKGIAKRWVGTRAVVFDGFPLFGPLYQSVSHKKVKNAFVTTALGSGGCSFAPAALVVNGDCTHDSKNPLTAKILRYASSKRTGS